MEYPIFNGLGLIWVKQFNFNLIATFIEITKEHLKRISVGHSGDAYSFPTRKSADW